MVRSFNPSEMTVMAVFISLWPVQRETKKTEGSERVLQCNKKGEPLGPLEGLYRHHHAQVNAY